MKKNMFKSMMLMVLLLTLTMLSSEIVSASTVTKIRLDHKGVTMYKGKSIRLTVKVKADKAKDKKVKWSSTNSKIAKVNSKGEVKAVKAGTAYIKATSKANKKLYAKCKVTVLLDESKNVKFYIMENKRIFAKIPSQMVSNTEDIQKIIQLLENDSHYNDFPSHYEELIKKLKKYDKSFFKDHVLYFRQHIQGYDIAIKTGAVERILKSNGKYKLKLILTNYKYSEPVDVPARAQGYWVFAEAPKSFAKTVDQVQVKFEFLKK